MGSAWPKARGSRPARAVMAALTAVVSGLLLASCSPSPASTASGQAAAAHPGGVISLNAISTLAAGGSAARSRRQAPRGIRGSAAVGARRDHYEPGPDPPSRRACRGRCSGGRGESRSAASSLSAGKLDVPAGSARLDHLKAVAAAAGGDRRLRRVRRGVRAGVARLYPAGLPRRGRDLPPAPWDGRRRGAVRAVRDRHGAVLASLTILTAWFGEGLVARMRSLAPHIGWASAVLLWLVRRLRRLLLAPRHPPAADAPAGGRIRRGRRRGRAGRSGCGCPGRAWSGCARRGSSPSPRVMFSARRDLGVVVGPGRSRARRRARAG